MAEIEIPKGVAKHVKDAMFRLQKSGLPYKPGDFIGTKYEVYGVLGWGGFGVVYLVYERDQKVILALKTFRDEYLSNDRIRELFHKEAQTWVDLGRHHYLVRAYWVDDVAGRLYISMEYIAPADERGLNSLQGYLEHQPPDLAQSLRWAIQFCYGMEYVKEKGIPCHRDIKPNNIMISDNTIKISDFGLAGISAKEILGYKRYMPPEAEQGEEPDVRGDIYSFGMVLWQMAKGSANLPSRGLWGRMPSMDGPLQPIIQRCLKESPKERYQTFEELREVLETLLKEKTGGVITPPKLEDLEAWEWNNKGRSLANLGKPDEAIPCFDEALKINPRYAEAYVNRGLAYDNKGEYERAISDYNEALEINPKLAVAYSNRGLTYRNKGEYDRAISDYNKAIEINPRDAEAYFNKAQACKEAGSKRDAVEAYKAFIQYAPPQYASYIEQARQRIRELEGGKQ